MKVLKGSRHPQLPSKGSRGPEDITLSRINKMPLLLSDPVLTHSRPVEATIAQIEELAAVEEILAPLLLPTLIRAVNDPSQKTGNKVKRRTGALSQNLGIDHPNSKNRIRSGAD